MWKNVNKGIDCQKVSTIVKKCLHKTKVWSVKLG